MIDDKTIAQWEQDAIDAGLLGYAEAFRNARRYLALRERFITEWLCNHDYGPGKELESSSARLHLDIPSTTAGIGVPPTSPVDAIVIDAALCACLAHLNAPYATSRTGST